MAKKSMEERLQAIEDINEILLLKGRYVDGADGGWTKLSHNADAVAALFVEDGSWEAEGFVRAVGRKQIHAAFRGMRVNTPIACHISANPMIRVKGDTATGVFHVLVMTSDREGHDMFTAGQYHDTFVRTPKGWRFKSLLCKFFFSGPYADGWTRQVQNFMSGNLVPKSQKATQKLVKTTKRSKKK
jgi:hypothetical protein